MLKKSKLPLFLILLFYIFYFCINKADWIFLDAKFFSSVETHPITFSFSRYFSWSSRFWIEGATVFASRHLFFFFIFTLSFLFLLVFSVSNIFKFNKFSDNLIFSVMFTALFPFTVFNSAGWIATTVNYLWPISLLSFWIMSDFKKELESISVTQLSISLLCLILSVFNEGLAIFSFGYMLFKFISFKQTIFNRYNWSCLLISMAGIMNALFCPGNALRIASEIKRWFPKFRELSFFDKLAIQFNHIWYDIIVNNSLIIITLLIFLFLLSIKYKKIAPSLLFFFSLLFVQSVKPKLVSIIPEIAKASRSGESVNDLLNSLLNPTFYLILLIFSTAIGIFLLFEKSWYSLIMIGSLTISFAVGMAASLSPTLLASSDRPFLIIYFIIVFFTIFIAKNLLSESLVETIK